MNLNKVIFIMGVSGVGKSTIGALLSAELNIPYFDGDDFHSEENISKMSNGMALNDEDRQGWLKILNNLAKEQIKTTGCIIVCSALKQKYRDILNQDIIEKTNWVYLKGSFQQIKERMESRSGHFMSPQLLVSQFETLEAPKNAIDIDISLTPLEIINTLKNTLVEKSEFGLFGLGVMGKSLARNLASKGFKLSMFNRHVAGAEEDVAINFKNEFEELATSKAFDDLEFFVNSLQTPRKMMLMVNAGKIIDSVIEDLLPYLSEGDILIDGGNSNYKNTKERCDYLKSKNIYFIGAGISGGEEGALKGPSIMPGGNKEIYKQVQPFLEVIAAKDMNNLPCCTYIGEEGSGHFVKMVHNGIEYVEMQLLAEVSTILKTLGNNPDQIAAILESWKPSVNSYLLEITIDIFRKKEENDWLVNKIMDKAGNKGTGNWTTITTAELGVPSTLIASALFARYTSFYKEERVVANKNFGGNRNLKPSLTGDEILKAYQFSRIINHYQGLKLIFDAAKSYQWDLNLSEIARIWTNGCIIKSDLMFDLVDILREAHNILTNQKIVHTLTELKPSVNKVVSECVLAEIPISCLSESVNFLNMYSTANSSANIIQAQRDYFGAHTYQRIDDDSGKFHHSIWK
ncbi:NADP-dependent phosphogluconate dehydrogenase [Mariniflexile litorale]|uniref:6-phosphogluconate dehydrogenase, decarboxylating n=1 Tax=Mariniflexile litorale TaxID=3045158 RepID=A0AAU7EF40_9FLAO|nr:NADP-dependent phosphogluconate dehydrogenase [Mariniflexile sp. KMM 9835]MDQ8212912.1 NADP-dependent phosphogluconate dehydrogenase [Mariniflexile sp. KMM 9835]